MLEELRKYKNLGTPEYFWELFEQLRNGDSWTTGEIEDYFYNKIIDGRSIFDGCLPLLLSTKIITVDEEGAVNIGYPYKYIFYSKQLCRQRLLEGFLLAFKEDSDFYNIFTPEYSSYDFVYKAINIDYSAFGLKYANIRNLFIDFGFLKPHLDFPNRAFMINSRWKKFFEKEFTPEIRKRKIGIEELKSQQEQQQLNGKIAEEFVLGFEQTRLNNKDGIGWIAPYDSGAGFDILSFQKESSSDNDLFIEVKSYSGTMPYFYWTRNEIARARKDAKKYCIYLVNRDELKNPTYKPRIISNPIKNILDDERWEKEVDKYYITEKE